MGSAGRTVRRGGVPAGAGGAGSAGHPGGCGHRHGAGCHEMAVEAGGGVPAAGSGAGRDHSGAGTGGGVAVGTGAETVSGGHKLARYSACQCWILLGAAVLYGTGGTAWRGRAVAGDDIGGRTDTDGDGAARHGEYAAGSGQWVPGAGAGTAGGGRPVVAGGGAGVGGKCRARGENGAAASDRVSGAVHTAAFPGGGDGGGAAAGGAQRLHRGERQAVPADTGGTVGAAGQRWRRIPRPVGRGRGKGERA